jgi:aminoglycoside 6'-N-acetyltransferase I
MHALSVREILESDRDSWVEMRDALWPGSRADHQSETQQYFAAPHPRRMRVFIAEAEGRIVGFLELDLRSYAPECTSSPVPFIEGWYVEPAMQRQGVGRALVEAAEAWARAAGHDEIASDAEIDNGGSIAAHRALGYEEVDRVVCFRKALPAYRKTPEA